MAGRGRKKPTGPRGLCAYLVEVQDTDGFTTVPEESAFLVKKCIQDKIFSLSGDQICVRRSDANSEEERIKFVDANWDGLKSGLESISSAVACEVGGVKNPIDCIIDIIRAMVKQLKEDTYEDKKILFFANLASYILDKEELEKLAEKLLQFGIFISIVLPNKDQMTDLQVQNSKLVKSVFEQEKYEEVAIVKSLREAGRQIINTTTKETKKPWAWNCPMEVTPEIIINVSGYVCTRKNKVGEMTRVLMKQCPPTKSTAQATSSATSSLPLPAITSGYPVSPTTTNTTDTQSSSVSSFQSLSQSISGNPDNQEKTVVVELAKNVLQKEKVWTDNDGNTVDNEDIGIAYYYGDKLIPFNELESEGAYESGEKCLKLLAFCPPENINAALLTGDGTTLFYPRKDDMRAEVMFKALLQAMANLNRVAVVRKVYLANKRPQVGVLLPDTDRECLVYSEICYADDISIPQMPILARQEDLDEEDAVTNAKDELIDKFIKSKSIDQFSIADGPADPAASSLRDEVARKILREDRKDDKLDTIGIYFESLVNEPDISETLLQIRSSFPLTENKANDSERLAGSNIFRKRPAELPIEPEEEKKPKLEVKEEEDDSKEEQEGNQNEMDDLLDEL